MRSASWTPGGLEGSPEILAALADAGVRSVPEALAASECVRDLPARSNHRLRLGGACYHLKRSKRAPPAGAPAEAAGLLRAAAAGVPTATLAFYGVDPDHGALTATLDLAPAEPLDALLARGALGPDARGAVLRRLARAVAALHAARLHHRDLYANHVYVDPAAPERLAIVDWERVGAHRRRLGRRVVKDLGALLSSLPAGRVSDGEQVAFLLRYLSARGLAARGNLERLARRVRRKARRIHAHPPRTPVGEAARP